MKLDYRILITEKDIEDAVAQMLSLDCVCFDLETTSVKTHSGDIEIVGAGFSWKKGQGIYIPFNHPDLQDIDLLEKISPVIVSIPLVGHNIKYDLRVLHRFGQSNWTIDFDTMIAHYCIHSDRFKHSLDDLVLHCFNFVKTKTKSLIPKKTKANPTPNLGQAPIEEVGLYCMEDTDYTFQLAQYYKYLLSLDYYDYARKLYEDIEGALLPVLIKMECTGAVLDQDKINDLRETIEKDIGEIQARLDEAAGQPLTVSNPTQVIDLVYNKLKVDQQLGITIGRTSTGKHKTDAATLEKLSSNSVVKDILGIKKLNKLLSTYVIALPAKICSDTGRIHAYFNQHKTATGRLSANEPNLQNIPSRDAFGKKVRSCFVSRWKGGKILAADYSQAELRILAHITDEPAFMKVFTEGGDAHLSTASMVLNKTPDEVTKTERTFFKTITFGILYGMGPKKLSQELKISKEEAANLLAQYLGKMTKVRAFIEDTKAFFRRHGYTETLFGRRRYISKQHSGNTLDEWGSERECVNHIIQGSNADIIKIAMVRVAEAIENAQLQSCMIIQVHDEIVLDVHPDELDVINKLVVDIMQSAVSLNVPMITDPTFADNWADAH